MEYRIPPQMKEIRRLRYQTGCNQTDADPSSFAPKRFRYHCIIKTIYQSLANIGYFFIWTSIDCGCSSKADIGALAMFFYNLKSNRILCKFKHFFLCLRYYSSIETKARWKIDR